MPDAKIIIDVNGSLLPWILVNQPVGVQIVFQNSSGDVKNVQFMMGAPPDIPTTFNVPAGSALAFTLDGENAVNGSYPYSVSGGGSGNGGIEIGT